MRNSNNNNGNNARYLCRFVCAFEPIALFSLLFRCSNDICLRFELQLCTICLFACLPVCANTLFFPFQMHFYGCILLMMIIFFLISTFSFWHALHFVKMLTRFHWCIWFRRLLFHYVKWSDRAMHNMFAATTRSIRNMFNNHHSIPTESNKQESNRFDGEDWQIKAKQNTTTKKTHTRSVALAFICRILWAQNRWFHTLCLPQPINWFNLSIWQTL